VFDSERNTIGIHRHGDPTRDSVEAFIRSIYRDRYSADVPHWAPSLMSLANEGTVVAAVGYRAAIGPLFLERYLSEPVEVLIGAQAGTTVSRGRIFEVGHFAAARPGAGRAMMSALARHLARNGCAWVVCTATRQLRTLFTRIGLPAFALAPAHASRLGSDAAAWGTYYDHSPVVLAGSLPQGLAALEGRREEPTAVVG
jgi:hypothetical protein